MNSNLQIVFFFHLTHEIQENKTVSLPDVGVSIYNKINHKIKISYQI